MVYKPLKGTYEIDRIFPHIGRARIRTGTHDKRLADRYELMLESLPLETVRLILDRKIPLRVAYDAWSAGQGHTLPTAQSIRPLTESWKAWVLANPVSVKENAHRSALLSHLTGVASIGGLPERVRVWRSAYRKKGAAFNRMRASVMAFLRDDLGTRHNLYQDVRAIEPLEEVRKFKRHPCTVAEAKAIMRELREPWKSIWWALCCTGMEPKEYWTDGWKPVGIGLDIYGVKAKARNRVVPRIITPPQPVGKPAGFAEALERADVDVTPMDARRSYARWLDEVGLPDYRQDAYKGHGPKTMRELYKWGDISSWLAEDRKVLTKYVGEKALRVAK